MRQSVFLQSWTPPGSHVGRKAVGEFHQRHDEEEKRALSHSIQGMVHNTDD